MTLALTISEQEHCGKSLRVYGSIALSGNYTTGGDAISWKPVLTGNRTPRIVTVEGFAGYKYEYDRTNSKLIVRGSGSGKANVAYAPGGGDIKGSANTDSENVDAAANPTNGDYVDTLHAVAAGAWSYTEDLEPDVTRNVVITILNDSGGALNLYEGVTTLQVSGTRRGVVQVDLITFTSTAGNKSVANTKYRYKYGVKPFDTITNVTVTNMPADGLKIGVGLGSKLGLPADTFGGVEADITKITKNGANLSPTGLFDATNTTVNLGTLANGDDVGIQFNSQAGPGAELPTATAYPSAVTGDVIRFEAVFPSA